MGVKASLASSLSVRPNFIPRSSQVASRRDFGVMGWTITPTKASEPGVALTASVIVNSSSSGVFETRPSLLHHLFGGAADDCSIAEGCASFRAIFEGKAIDLRFAGRFPPAFGAAQRTSVSI